MKQSAHAKGNSFFLSLVPVINFSSITDFSYYRDAPDDWMVVIADIRNSTGAVDAGRYKDVNLAAGCVITAILNATGDRGLPFVFGGDGATMLAPGSDSGLIREALARTRQLVKDSFGFDLRIGLVPVADVRERQVELKVARLELSRGNSLALFSGGGVEMAEHLVREDADFRRYAIAPRASAEPPDLHGLSCRWEPLESRHGAMLCVLVRPLGSSSARRALIIESAFQEIAAVFDNNLKASQPVAAKNMRFRWPPRGLKSEALVTRGSHSFLLRYTQILCGSFIQLILERFNLKGGNYDAPIYRQELRANSDYCRFDDTLRMVLDCRPDQISDIRLLLKDLQRAQQIEFGLFETRRALMTCLVSDLGASRHLHFIDGDDGGFWSAAKELKAQRAGKADASAPVGIGVD